MIHWMTRAVTRGLMLKFWRMERNSLCVRDGERETRQTVRLAIFFVCNAVLMRWEWSEGIGKL